MSVYLIMFLSHNVNNWLNGYEENRKYVNKTSAADNKLFYNLYTLYT